MVTLAKCEGNNPGEKFSDAEVIEACMEVLNTRDLHPLTRRVVLYARGDAYARLGKDFEAIKDFTERLRFFPTTPVEVSTLLGPKSANELALSNWQLRIIPMQSAIFQTVQ